MLKRRLLEVVGLLLLGGCSETRTETWQVAAHRASCTGEATGLCLIVQRPSSSSPQLHYFGIVGFAPQWGHEYTIGVQLTPVSNPPQDGSSEDVTLRGVQRDEVVSPGTTFQFRVFESGSGQNALLSVTAGDAGQLADGAPFVCQAGAGVCEQIRARLESGTPFEITFAHGDGALIALAVADSPSPSPPSF